MKITKAVISSHPALLISLLYRSMPGVTRNKRTKKPTQMYFGLSISTISGILILVCVCVSAADASKVLSRKKRYVAFPEGSSFSCAGCVTVGVIGQPAPTTAPGTFTWGMNWGIAYELPNATETARFYRRHKGRAKAVAVRRTRRELYEKLEIILENIGYNGRDCILKTLCETKQRIAPNGGNMMQEMFRSLFSLPMTKVFTSEPEEHTIYDAAYRLSHILDDCDQYKCPISIIDLVKGYYRVPASRLDTALNPWALFSSSFG